jgi:hypothetical protein
MGIFIIALVTLIITAVLWLMDGAAKVPFTWLGKTYDVSGSLFFFVTVAATALVCWVVHLVHQRQIKERLRERQQELSEVKDRLRRAESSLEEHESKIHEFTLQVLQLARAPLPDHARAPQPMVFEETVERSALGPASANSDDANPQNIPKVPEPPQDTI